MSVNPETFEPVHGMPRYPPVICLSYCNSGVRLRALRRFIAVSQVVFMHMVRDKRTKAGVERGLKKLAELEIPHKEVIL